MPLTARPTTQRRTLPLWGAAMLGLGQMAGIVHAQPFPAPPPLVASSDVSVYAASAPVISPPFDEPLVIDACAGSGVEPLVIPQSEAIPTPQWIQDGESILRSPLPYRELQAQRPGWVAALSVSVLRPYIASEITSGAALNGTFPNNPVALPVGAMNFTGAPRVELGYRWPDGLGEFRTTFQLFNASGNRTIPDLLPGSTRSLTSQLQMNIVDFDYCFSEFNLGDMPLIPVMIKTPGWLGLRRPQNLGQTYPLVMRLRLGCRAMTMFTESQASGTQILNESLTNNFAGAGLHIALEMTKAMPWKPLSMYGKLDFAGVLGPVNQTFQRTDALGNSASAVVRVNDGSPFFGIEWGVQWVPVKHPNLRGTLAYQYMQWWQFADTDDSTASLLTNGVLLSGQWGF